MKKLSIIILGIGVAAICLSSCTASYASASHKPGQGQVKCAYEKERNTGFDL